MCADEFFISLWFSSVLSRLFWKDIVVGSNVPPDIKEKVGFFLQKTNGFLEILGKRYLRAYLELENNTNIQGYLLIEICSFPMCFEILESIRGI